MFVCTSDQPKELLLK